MTATFEGKLWIMNKETIELLADALKEYYGNYELEELCSRFDVGLEYIGVSPNHFKLAGGLVTNRDLGQHKQFLKTIIPDLMRRCSERIANTTWDSNVFDEQMQPHLRRLNNLLGAGNGNGNGGSTRSTSECIHRMFPSKAAITRFMGGAKTMVIVVNTQIGPATFDCLKEVRHPLRLLIRKTRQAPEDRFKAFLHNFRSMDYAIEVRRHPKLHDHYVFFNGRLWLTNSSLSSAGNKTLNIIECVDSKVVIARQVERWWREAEVFFH